MLPSLLHLIHHGVGRVKHKHPAMHPRRKLSYRLSQVVQHQIITAITEVKLKCRTQNPARQNAYVDLVGVDHVMTLQLLIKFYSKLSLESI